jgi:hypothetical protein
MLNSQDWNLYLQTSGCADQLLDQYFTESRKPDYNHDVAMHYINLSNQARAKAIQLINEGLDD